MLRIGGVQRDHRARFGAELQQCAGLEAEHGADLLRFEPGELPQRKLHIQRLAGDQVAVGQLLESPAERDRHFGRHAVFRRTEQKVVGPSLLQVSGQDREIAPGALGIAGSE